MPGTNGKGWMITALIVIAVLIGIISLVTGAYSESRNGWFGGAQEQETRYDDFVRPGPMPLKSK